ncbi:MAG: hypothetical protein RXS23_02945 [Metallosphaera yellowstonensis]|jgi:hypothetical protein|uniref:Uncharacterized protein n=1 Tax=Metallosphaera yellowstonensis MK1 TaxID=671065 RepID=H2C691_9CREN|nr:hypothetical protein [Metallosphaera yellowstonensis]EHP69318.1 hypothetical protein MetMK1DRAFT_00020680 [Metallosphaera yellowstonensis MK1]
MDDIRETLIKVLKKLDPTIREDSVTIKYVQNFKDRYDVFGQFANGIGLYEFAVSFDEKGNIKRDHVNMIAPHKIREELEKKLYDKGD